MSFDDSTDDDVVETDPTGRFDRFRKIIGRGAYKEVYKAYDQEEGVEVAWNQIRMDTFSSVDLTRIYNEILILQSLRNENIINLLHSWKAPATNGKETIYFVTELMTSGTLKQYISKTKGPIKPKIIWNWCRQILRGLNYLHTKDPPIIHRDLKCDNIFINGNNGQAKIGDLGLAAIKESVHLSSVLGTPEFMAPELYDEKYDEKVDIYAFGLVVLEIATKKYPYSECTNQAQIYKKVTSGIKPAALENVEDPSVREFIELCITHDAKSRPSAATLLNHPFLVTIPAKSATELECTSPLFTAAHTSEIALPALVESGGEKDNYLATSGTFGHIGNEATVVSKEQHHFEFSRTDSPIVASVSCKVESEASSNPDEVMLHMEYRTKKNSVQISFPFNLAIDTATDVVSELVGEKLINAVDEQLVRRRIEEVVRGVLIKQRESVSDRSEGKSPNFIDKSQTNSPESSNPTFTDKLKPNTGMEKDNSLFSESSVLNQEFENIRTETQFINRELSASPEGNISLETSAVISESRQSEQKKRSEEFDLKIQQLAEQNLMLFDNSNPKTKVEPMFAKQDNNSPLGGNSAGEQVSDPTTPLTPSGSGNFAYTRDDAVESQSQMMLGLQTPLIPERYEFVKQTGNEHSTG